MSLLSKIIGDNQRLKGPDLSKAGKCTIDLSGTKLTFLVPEKTLMIPTVFQRSSIDISNQKFFNTLELMNIRAMSVDIHSNGWVFKGKYGRSLGYTMFDIRLIKIAPEKLSFSFFDVNNFKRFLLHYADSLWGSFNRETTEEYAGTPPKKHLWTYPTTREHLFKSNNAERLHYFVSLPGGGIKAQYWVPIGGYYVLKFDFVPNPIDCDFYSPEHNLPRVTEQFIQEFMQNVKITLSPDALAEKLTRQ